MRFKYPRTSPFFVEKLLCLFNKDLNNFMHYWNSIDNKSWIFSRSTWSLVSIILLRTKLNKRKVIIWLPSYYCGSVINIISRLNISIIYYELDNCFNPIFPKLSKLNKPDILVLVHYFPKALNIPKLISDFDSKHTTIVEDATQCFLPYKNVGKFANFTMYSPYKFLPSSCGAILVSDQSLGHLNEDTRKHIVKQIEANFDDILESNFASTINFLKWFVKQNLIRFNLFFIRKPFFELRPIFYPKIEHPNMSFLNYLIFRLNTLNIDFVKNRRENNLLVLTSFYKNLSKINVTNNNFNTNVCNCLENHPYLPITLPIALNNVSDSLHMFNRFLKYGFHVNVWPDLPDFILNNSCDYDNTINLRMTIIHLPINQFINYNIEDLNSLFENFKNK